MSYMCQSCGGNRHVCGCAKAVKIYHYQPILNPQLIVHVKGKGKTHIWTNQSADEYGGHYLSVCGRQFGIEWTLESFQYRGDLCLRCAKAVIE